MITFIVFGLMGLFVWGMLSFSKQQFELLKIYRRLWWRQPLATRNDTLRAMQCWAPEAYHQLIKDLEDHPKETGE